MSATASTSAAELATANANDDAGDVEPGALSSTVDDAQTTPCSNAIPQAARPVGRPADPSNCHVNYEKIADRSAVSSLSAVGLSPACTPCPEKKRHNSILYISLKKKTKTRRCNFGKQHRESNAKRPLQKLLPSSPNQ